MLFRVKFKAKAIGLLYEIENYGRFYSSSSSSDPSMTPSSFPFVQLDDGRDDEQGRGGANDSVDCTPHNPPSLINEILSSSDLSTPVSTIDVISVADSSINSNKSHRCTPRSQLQHSGSSSTLSSVSGPPTSASSSRKRFQQPQQTVGSGIRPTLLSPHYPSGYCYSTFSSKSNGNNTPPFIFPPGECDDQPLSEEMQKQHDIAILLSLESPLVTCRSNSSKHRSRKDDFSCRRYSLPTKLSSSTKTLLTSATVNLSAVSSPSDSDKPLPLPPPPPAQVNAKLSPLFPKKERSDIPVFVLPADNNSYSSNGNTMRKSISCLDIPLSSIKKSTSKETFIPPVAADGNETTTTFEHDENHPEPQQQPQSHPQHQPKNSPPKVSQEVSSSNHSPLSTLSH
jgi:hypothetical protein